MSMGAYDEVEHERRERKHSEVEVNDDDRRTEYNGTVEHDSDESTEELLDQFREINS